MGDALSVLTAINMVRKDGNEYVWVEKSQEKMSLFREIEELKLEVERKKQYLLSLQEKAVYTPESQEGS